MGTHNHSSRDGLGVARSRYSMACYQVADYLATRSLEGRGAATVREISEELNTGWSRVRSALGFGDLFRCVGQLPAYRWELREGARELLAQAKGGTSS